MKTDTPKAGPMFQYETLNEALEHAGQRGYTEEFRLVKGGVRKGSSKEVLPPSALTIESTYRIEGLSDPAAQVTVYALQADDGSSGTLVESYGALVDQELVEFMDGVNRAPQSCNEAKADDLSKEG